MSAKVCNNESCPAYAHLVYTLAMRCVLCRCDLGRSSRFAGSARPAFDTQASGGATHTQQSARRAAR